MSLLVDIAEKAHVSVEGVVRVLTREPVSDAIKERVLAVLDELDAEQTRVLQRFALAALHDVLPRPYEAPLRPHVDDWDPDVPEAVRGLLPPAPAPAPLSEPPQLPAAPPDTAHLVQLSAVLEELASAVRDLRQETDTERRERVDDLAVLIELISTGWQGLDRRLGRLERQLGRLEAPRSQAPPPPPPPVLKEPPPAPPAAPPPVTPPPVEPGAKPERDRLPLAAALALVGVVVGTVAVLQLVSGDAETAGVVTGDALVETVAERPSTTVPTTTPERTTTRPRATRPTATTTSVLGTEAEQPPPATTEAPRPSGFRPTRNWAWAPVAAADYYDVQFIRDGATLYRATSRVPRLALPDSIEFGPGSYRWIVRPGVGPQADRRLGTPVVDSRFTVTD